MSGFVSPTTSVHDHAALQDPLCGLASHELHSMGSPLIWICSQSFLLLILSPSFVSVCDSLANATQESGVLGGAPCEAVREGHLHTEVPKP